VAATPIVAEGQVRYSRRTVGRRRLALATRLSEFGRPLVILSAAAVFLAVVGLAFLTSTQVSAGNANALVVLLIGVFALPYGLFVVQLFGGLRSRRLDERAARIDRGPGDGLHAMVGQVAELMGIQAPRSIWVSSGFELSCVGARNGYDVVLGLALLDVLNVTELRASVALLLARSFAGNELTARAFRSMQRWFDVVIADSAGNNAAGGLAKIVALRLVEMLGPETIVAERETAARSEAGRIAGEANLSMALLRASAYDSYSTDVFWPGLLDRHATNAEPPDAISQHRALCRSALPADEWERRLNRAAAELKLHAPTLVETGRENPKRSSDALLGPLAPTLTRAFDSAWRASVAKEWSAIRDLALKEAAELTRLESVTAERPLDTRKEWRRLRLRAQRADPAEALQTYRDWLQAHPLDAEAHLYAGRTALASRDPEAIALLEKAMAMDARYAAEATRLIAEELRAQGREAAAEPYWERNRVALAELAAALDERVRKKSDQPLLGHGLASDEVEVIVEHLRRFPMVASATLARRAVTVFPTVPCIVLGVRFTRSWFWWNTEKVVTVLGQIADCPLPVQIVAANLSGAKELARPPAVEIYRAGPVARREQLTRWGRRSQRVLIGIGGFFLLWGAIANRGCFPECWTHVNAIVFFVPMIVAVNLLMFGGTPDTAARRAVAFVASTFFAGFLYANGWTGLLPFAIASLARFPTERRAFTWAAGISIPAVAMGWLATQA